jgi:hypothetical protein
MFDIHISTCLWSIFLISDNDHTFICIPSNLTMVFSQLSFIIILFQIILSVCEIAIKPKNKFNINPIRPSQRPDDFNVNTYGTNYPKNHSGLKRKLLIKNYYNEKV